FSCVRVILLLSSFFLNYPSRPAFSPLSLHDALPIYFTVHIAADAQAGLEILEAQGDNIGVLVSDQRMPGESGVELLKKVRRHWRSEEHTSELQSRFDLVCRLLLEKKKTE